LLEENAVARKYYLDGLLRSTVGSHLMETILTLMPSPEYYQSLYEKCFKGKMVEFSLDPVANYVVQQLLSTMPSGEIIPSLLDELKPEVSNLLCTFHPNTQVFFSHPRSWRPRQCHFEIVGSGKASPEIY
jgi:hypothetical protein